MRFKGFWAEGGCEARRRRKKKKKKKEEEEEGRAQSGVAVKRRDVGRREGREAGKRGQGGKRQSPLRYKQQGALEQSLTAAYFPT